MKVLAIRIRNLASLEGTTEIDFTRDPLRSTGIFAITGPTGAGKSTILDALCLALYAKTPRYAQAREIGIELADVQGSTINQSDVRAMLRDGTAEGYAEVDFVGIDGQHYRANWHVRRARNRIEGSLQQANTTLKNLTADSDIGGRKTELLPEITRLVGLNYDQFTRSVLLAQGDFTAFLKADKDQKASLLEKLTGTNIYSALSKKVFERHREEDQQLKFLQQRQEGIAILTIEELANLKEQEATLAKNLDELNARIDAVVKEIKWHEDLSNHQAHVAQAHQMQQARIVEKEQAGDREKYLKQVEQVQSTHTWIDALRDATDLFVQRQEALTKIQTQGLLLADRVAEIEATVIEAIEHLASQTVNEEEAKPLLDQAKKLDVQLQATEVEIAAAQQQLDIREAKWEASQKHLLQHRHEAESLAQQIEKLQEWKGKHLNRQPVAENRTRIVTKLDDARMQLEAIETASKTAIRYETAIKEKTTEHTRFTQRSGNLTKEVSEAKRQLEALQRELSAHSIEQLHEENKALSAMVEDIRSATDAWRQVYKTQQDISVLSEKAVHTQKELADNDAALAAAVTALQAVTEQRKASAAMLAKAMLAASENVEALRAGLVDGQPCPVCGSETHRYVHGNPQLNQVLDELKKAHDTLEISYNDHLSSHSQLSQSATLFAQTITAIERDIQIKHAELRVFMNDWDTLVVSQACSGIAAEEREAWLAEQLTHAKAKQDTIARQLEHYQTVQSRRETIRQAWQHLQSEHTAMLDELKDSAHILQTLNERLTLVQSEQSANANRLGQSLNSLQAYFPDELWIANWKSQPDAFLESINTFADEWEQVTEVLARDRNKLDVLQATITGLQNQEHTLAADAAQSRRDLAGKQAIYQTLSKSRQSIFAGEAVGAIEARLKQRVVEAQEQLNSQKQQQERLQTDKARANVTAMEIEREIARLEKRRGELSGKIEQWLTEYNAKQQDTLDRDGLQALLAHPVAWIAEERAALSAIEHGITQATSVLDERMRVLAQHKKKQPSDQSPDVLREQVAALQTSRLASQQDHSEIGFQLKQHEANKRQLGDLLATIQAQATIVENWSKLNEIIGSADGKKFRQVAQEYTLDVLLTYANVHLEVLSKRYCLQRIPNTLGLQVIDQDMGDEVRTVYSLSGGESFLVSLALALGLASLSANRMNVESLFIDEGFGSLDPDTLNIAMDALERLHNQGRKVGVISHVQEMTERIPVQIKVSKLQQGRSGVAVVE
ncbi:AAA family ATPase [Parapedobacter pyrenivorans]|uniref:AAA family ATPase n=1 Tax=Parapedobacter pyrenivorans TaxID=1305674 RepID=UPI003341F173